jgi:very-short-patch-repair endonuclease
MGSIAFLAVIVVLGSVLFLALAKKRQPDDAGPWPYYPKKPLSAPEQILYFRLNRALPDHIVLAQVQLSRLLGVKKGNNYQAWLNRINRMSADFVVCHKDSTILAVIELDDATHNESKRQEADAKKDKALTAAGIKIHRWQAKMIPDEAAIKTALIPQSVGSDRAVATA